MGRGSFAVIAVLAARWLCQELSVGLHAIHLQPRAQPGTARGCWSCEMERCAWNRPLARVCGTTDLSPARVAMGHIAARIPALRSPAREPGG